MATVIQEMSIGWDIWAVSILKQFTVLFLASSKTQKLIPN
jgi:hypothetical protein